MNEQTEQITKPEPAETHHSEVLGISLRGWIALIIVLTVCYMSVAVIEVKEPLYTLAGMVLGYYFAQSQQKKNTP